MGECYHVARKMRTLVAVKSHETQIRDARIRAGSPENSENRFFKCSCPWLLRFLMLMWRQLGYRVLDKTPRTGQWEELWKHAGLSTRPR
jgi:hypothetical protein